MIKAIIFDYGFTIYDPEKKGFQLDAIGTIETLAKKYKLILVSRAGNTKRRLEEIEKIGLDQYFDYLQVVSKEEESKNFESILNHYKYKPTEYLVIGDRITSEITEGNRLGMKTCRFLYGPEKSLVPENNLETANFEIESLAEIIDILNYGDID